VKTLCTLEVDVRAVPQAAFELRNGKRGAFYEVRYNLALCFGPELIFSFRHEDTVVGSVVSKYN
jgi:hypothetical protein